MSERLAPRHPPSSRYFRLFNALAAGAFLFVTGVIGFDIAWLRGWFAGGRWVDGPIWWQIGLGTALLALAAWWFRHLEDP